ncbi:MAG: HEPN domain-containing protein [Anaerolineales bacterium]|nr:HEPN domain-containing protein [Anaerolineales bacterium]
MATAEEDLLAAQTLKKDELFAHACFLTQQCGGKAIKSMWFAIGEDPWGHSIQRLVREFPQSDKISDMETWQKRAASLDKFYIPTRYPNGLPDLTPGQSYFLSDAEEAISQATFFLNASRRLLEENA